MPQRFTTTIGGREREFKYTFAEREQIEHQFKMGMFDFVRQQVIPLNADNVPTGGGIFRSQVAFIFFGLRHHGKGVTLTKISEQLKKHIIDGGNVYEVLGQASQAMMRSGVLGFQTSDEDEEDEEGKAESPSSSGEDTSGSTP